MTRTSRRVRGAAPTSSGLTDDFREPSDGAHSLTEDHLRLRQALHDCCPDALAHIPSVLYLDWLHHVFGNH